MNATDRWPLQTTDIQVAGLRTRLMQGGANPRANEAVVFVHGNPGAAEDWSDLMGRVAPHGRVIALDMPGFGHADKPPTTPTRSRRVRPFSVRHCGNWV